MTTQYIVSLFLIFLSSTSSDPTVNVDIDGTTTTKFVNGGPVSVSGSTLTFPPSRFYLGDKDGQGGFGPDIFYSPNLLGGSIQYDIDLSQAGCSCNIALYTVSMPGHDWNGNPDPGQGSDYYCDANDGGGVWCPEMDIMEANTYAWHTTPHKCDPPAANMHYSYCDGGGCVKSMEKLGRDKYGPGAGHQINTLQEFHAKIEFQQSDNVLSAIVVTLTQGSNTVVLSQQSSECNGGYYAAMSGPLSQGMVLTISNWGHDFADMSWLDGGLCQGNCTNSPTAVISNIKYKTGGSGPPPPPPGNKWGCSDGGCSNGTGDYNDENSCLSPCIQGYIFGDQCAGNEQKCNPTCNDCRWSWPSNDPQTWRSKDAACRCRSASTPTPGSKWGCSDGGCSSGTGDYNDENSCLSPCTQGYTFGNACAGNVDKCNQSCVDCRWSWPSSDPAQWASKDAGCRCKQANAVSE